MFFYTNSRFSYNLSTSITIFNIIFRLISFNNHGGSIYINNIDLFSELKSCTFENCSSTKNGGCIAILNSKKTIFKSICIFFGKAQFNPGYVIYGHVYTSFHSELNFTSDFNPDLSGACSFICSQHIITSNNNVSYSLTNFYSSGFYYGSILSEKLALYTQISFSNGLSMIGISMIELNLSPSFHYINFINNSCQSYWIEFNSFNTNPFFYNCQFKDINNKPLISLSGLIQFINCEFNFLYNNFFHSNISSNINSFNISILINSFSFNNYYCWNGNKTKNIFIGNYLFNFLIVFIL